MFFSVFQVVTNGTRVASDSEVVAVLSVPARSLCKPVRSPSGFPTLSLGKARGPFSQVCW